MPSVCGRGLVKGAPDHVEADAVIIFLQYVVNGLAAGSVIGLLALSVVMIYRSTRVLSFAQGAIASLSTYVYFQMQTVQGWPTIFALAIALAIAAGIGALSERAVMRPLRQTDALTRTVATLGLVLVLQVVMRTFWGGDETFVSKLSTARVTMGSFTVGVQELVTAIVATVAALGLSVWTRASYRGLALSAMAQDPETARLLGVDPKRASALAWSLAAVLAALAGILVTPTLVLNPLQMTLIMVTSFGAALLGGFLSIPLALVGGSLIGVVQSVTTGYLNISGVSEAFGFIAVFAILLLTRSRKRSGTLARGWL